MSVLENMELSRNKAHCKRTIRSDCTPTVAKPSPRGTRDLCRDRADSLRVIRGRATAAVQGTLAWCSQLIVYRESGVIAGISVRTQAVVCSGHHCHFENARGTYYNKVGQA